MSKQTNNLQLHLYDTGDKFNITASNNSLNKNMKVIDGAVAFKANLEIVGEYTAPIIEFLANTTIDALSVGNKYFLQYIGPSDNALQFYADEDAAQNEVYACVIGTNATQIVPSSSELYQEVQEYGYGFDIGNAMEVVISGITNDTIKFYNTKYSTNRPKDLSDKQDKFAEISNKGQTLTIPQEDYLSVIIGNPDNKLGMNFDIYSAEINFTASGRSVHLTGIDVPSYAAMPTSATNKRYVDNLVLKATQPLISLATSFDWTIGAEDFERMSAFPEMTGVYKVTAVSNTTINFEDYTGDTQTFDLAGANTTYPIQVGDFIYVVIPNNGSGISISRVNDKKQDKFAEISGEGTTLSIPQEDYLTVNIGNSYYNMNMFFELETSKISLNDNNGGAIKLTGIATPTDANDAVNKAYVDAAIAAALNN